MFDQNLSCSQVDVLFANSTTGIQLSMRKRDGNKETVAMAVVLKEAFPGLPRKPPANKDQDSSAQ
jgi:hypothetical protein